MLVSYSQTPQVTALEYAEQRDLMKHPEKAEKYAAIISARTKLGKASEKKPGRKR